MISSLHIPIVVNDMVIASTIPDAFVFGVAVVAILEVWKDAVGLDRIGPEDLVAVHDAASTRRGPESVVRPHGEGEIGGRTAAPGVSIGRGLGKAERSPRAIRRAGAKHLARHDLP